MRSSSLMRMADRWLPLGGLVVLVLAWEAAVRGFAISDMILPTPSAVVRSFYYGLSSGIFVANFAVTAAEAIAALLVAIVVGTTVSAAIVQIPIIERATWPFVVAVQAMPKLALAPLVVVWFGYGPSSKVVLGAAIACLPILVNGITGLQSCEPGKIDVMRALNASEWQIFRLVKFPSALPFLFAGIHVAAAFVVLGAVMGEFLGAREGLGMLIINANVNLDTAQIFAILIMLGGLGFSLFTVTRLLERRLLAWTQTDGLGGAIEVTSAA